MSGPRTWVLIPRAEREMRSVPVEMRRRIVAALDRLVRDPRTADRRTLSGRVGEWRLRVGGWRVLYGYDVERQAVVVLRVLPRGRAERDRSRSGPHVIERARRPSPCAVLASMTNMPRALRTPMRKAFV